MVIVRKRRRLSRGLIPLTCVPCNQLRACAHNVKLHPRSIPLSANVVLSVGNHLPAKTAVLAMDVDGEHAEPGAALVHLAHTTVGEERAIEAGGDQDSTVGLGNFGCYARNIGDVDAGVVSREKDLSGCVGAEGRVDEVLELDRVFLGCEAKAKAIGRHFRKSKELRSIAVFHSDVKELRWFVFMQSRLFRTLKE